MESENNTKTYWLDRSLSTILPRWNVETLLVILVLVVAVVSRFYNVDLRVMSHDEVNHVVPSWDLFQGRGYRHDPVTHGPMQFHLVALSYFIMGDNDFSSRVPAVTADIWADQAPWWQVFCF
jgi:predicted membrane-bound mannosyltransferase